MRKMYNLLTILHYVQSSRIWIVLSKFRFICWVSIVSELMFLCCSKIVMIYKQSWIICLPRKNPHQMFFKLHAHLFNLMVDGHYCSFMYFFKHLSLFLKNDYYFPLQILIRQRIKSHHSCIKKKKKEKKNIKSTFTIKPYSQKKTTFHPQKGMAI